MKAWDKLFLLWNMIVSESLLNTIPYWEQSWKQAGAKLCQAQVKLEVIVDVVEEALS